MYTYIFWKAVIVTMSMHFCTAMCTHGLHTYIYDIYTNLIWLTLNKGLCLQFVNKCTDNVWHLQNISYICLIQMNSEFMQVHTEWCTCWTPLTLYGLVLLIWTFPCDKILAKSYLLYSPRTVLKKSSSFSIAPLAQAHVPWTYHSCSLCTWTHWECTLSMSVEYSVKAYWQKGILSDCLILFLS